MLVDEEATDNELRAKFNQRWNRTPSGDLYKPLKTGTITVPDVWKKHASIHLVERSPDKTTTQKSPNLLSPWYTHKHLNP